MTEPLDRSANERSGQAVMWHVILYLAFTALVVGYALARGGAPERIGAVFWVASNAASHVALSHPGLFSRIETTAFGIDLVTLGGFLTLALRAWRTWPIFVAAMLLCEVMVHVLRLVQPGMGVFGYAFGVVAWSYVIVLALAIGVCRHQARLKRGADPSWQPSCGWLMHAKPMNGPIV